MYFYALPVLWMTSVFAAIVRQATQIGARSRSPDSTPRYIYSNSLTGAMGGGMQNRTGVEQLSKV